MDCAVPFSRCDSRQVRLVLMLCLTGSFFFAELIVGLVANSLSLFADAFHMLSDVLSIIVGLVAIKISSRPKSKRFSFGWKRAEIVGGLINGVILLSLCFSILVDAVERFFEPKETERPVLVLIVASIGLMINILGMLLFHQHPPEAKAKVHDDIASNEMILPPKKSNTAMRSVFLHILGDALGSVAVICSTLFMWLTTFSWRFYVDPIISIIIVFILVGSSASLVKRTVMVVMQTTPMEFDASNLSGQIAKVRGVLSVHDLHIWQLDDSRLVATVHVVCASRAKFSRISSELREILHDAGVHSTTVQPEFDGKKQMEMRWNSTNSKSADLCQVRCTTLDCIQYHCCFEQESKLGV